MKSTLIGLAALMIVQIACKTKKQASVSSVPLASLQGTWVLYRIEGPKKDFDDLYPFKAPYIQFDETNMKMNGNSGCNTFSGSYGNNNGILDFTQPLISTKMACKGGGEAVFLQTLKKINGYEVKKDTLFLKMASLTMMYLYKK